MAGPSPNPMVSTGRIMRDGLLHVHTVGMAPLSHRIGVLTTAFGPDGPVG